MSRFKQVAGLLAWLALSYVAATVGAIASIHAADFYAQLAQPAWAPPSWVFGPVWTALYALMGIAAWLVWRDAGWKKRRAELGVFVAQLAFNALWSWLFFAWHRGGLAFADIALLWVLVMVTIVGFLRVHRLAGFLLAPYLCWISFAAALNLVVWRMNPKILG